MPSIHTNRSTDSEETAAVGARINNVNVFQFTKSVAFQPQYFSLF